MAIIQRRFNFSDLSSKDKIELEQIINRILTFRSKLTPIEQQCADKLLGCQTKDELIHQIDRYIEHHRGYNSRFIQELIKIKEIVKNERPPQVAKAVDDETKKNIQEQTRIHKKMLEEEQPEKEHSEEISLLETVVEKSIEEVQGLISASPDNPNHIQINKPEKKERELPDTSWDKSSNDEFDMDLPW